MLTVEGLEVAYGPVQAVRGVSFTAERGEISALVGPNGAGKSSILNAICGQAPRRAGRVTLDGVDVSRWPTHRLAQHGLVQAPEGRAIFNRMTVEENLLLTARDGRRELPEMYDRFPLLSERRTRSAGSLSGGEQQILAIARALLARPRALLLDEPSMGLAPKLVDEVFDLIASLRSEGVAIVLVEQNAYRALRIAHRAYVLERGVIVLEGEGAALLREPRVRAAYLGGKVNDDAE